MPTRSDAIPGRNEALTTLFTAHHGRLVGLARLLVDDIATAEDVVQDAFASLHQRWPRLRDANAAAPYLQSCVVNGSRSVLRRRRTALAHRRTDLVALPSAEQTAVARDEKRQLLSLLPALPRRQREVLVLRYYLDLSEAEIADALSISRGSVKTHASRGLSTLSARLEGTR